MLSVVIVFFMVKLSLQSKKSDKRLHFICKVYFAKEYYLQKLLQNAIFMKYSNSPFGA